jgi:TonB family protein
MLRFLVYTFLACPLIFFAQISSTDPEFEAKLVGGNQDIDQVIQTQLTLPKTMLTGGFEKFVTCYFNLDSAGRAVSLKYDAQLNNAMRAELNRMFRFFHFRYTLYLPKDERPYFLQFDLSTSKYNKMIKQKYRHPIRKPLAADSSYVVYTRADNPPVYYKNGEEGLNEYILEEIAYPPIARERSIQGTVMLEFNVETNGYITGITVKQPVNAGCTEEAIRIMKTTRWQPARIGDKFVRYRMSYPITFNLSAGKSTYSAAGTIGD